MIINVQTFPTSLLPHWGSSGTATAPLCPSHTPDSEASLLPPYVDAESGSSPRCRIHCELHVLWESLTRAAEALGSPEGPPMLIQNLSGVFSVNPKWSWKWQSLFMKTFYSTSGN